jgi:hypothetical protein
MDLVLYAQDAESWRTWVALSNGDGTFSSAVPWSVAGNWLDSTMLAGDLNGDERADLVSLTQRDGPLRVSVALSNGAGSFQTVFSEAAGNYAGWTSALGDVNGDSRRDLILQKVNETGWLAHVALNRGDGRFTAPAAWSAPGDFRNAHAGIGDFNGDGRTDVAVENYGPDAWRSWVALSVGTGTFGAPIQSLAPGEFTGWTPARGDFNGDGRTDLRLWTYDTEGWRSRIAISDGNGSFLAPVTWAAEDFGPSWTFLQGDFNGDGATDIIAQHADEKGWNVNVAVSRGDGTFIRPKRWGAPQEPLGEWAVSVMDVTGDGRTDVIAQFYDSSGWRTRIALARPCDTVISNQDDFAGHISALPSLPGGQVVCFKPGVYEGEILIARKRDLTLVAPHGDVSIASTSVMSSISAEGLDPGAPMQIWESEFIDIDDIRIQNRHVYQPPSGDDQTYTVSRAIEVIRSGNVTLSYGQFSGAGKQTIHIKESRGVTVAETVIECYYFCVDARASSFYSLRSHFRANHQQIPNDDHAIFWTAHSDQRYVNSTIELITGKAVFAGINDFSKNRLELAGETVVSRSAEGWVAQHPNYDGLNLRLRGTYTDLQDWYFIGGSGAGWQTNAQICYEPDIGWAHCVGRFNGVSTPTVSESPRVSRLLECRQPEGKLESTLAQLGIDWNR